MYGSTNTTLGIMILVSIAMLFLVGFIPGFYLSFLIFTKAKLQRASAALFSVIVGVISGGFGFQFYALKYEVHNANWTFFANALPFIIAFEIIVVAIHFFLSRTQKRKNNTQKRK